MTCAVAIHQNEIRRGARSFGHARAVCHQLRLARRGGRFFVAAIIAMGLVQSVFAQASNEILTIDPSSAAPGTGGLVVSFTLDTDTPAAPPTGALPDSVMLGSLVGTSVAHASQYVVTATFDIPANQPLGAIDAVITWSPPEGTLTFSMTDGFTVTAGADTPPSIAQQPQPKKVQPGGAVTFTVVAYGTEPLSYQWRKDMGDIAGATGASFTIDPVDWSDAGDYRCVVTNDFGDATSNAATLTVAELPSGAYPIVDTAQDACYNASIQIADPAFGAAFYGQDGQIVGNTPSYTVSADGLTVYDNVTGLTWTRSPDLSGDGVIDVGDKLTFDEALTYADTVLNPANFGGYDDWRLPTMKQLYSLMDFRGRDPNPTDTDPSVQTPFIDTDYFDFAYGDLDAGERIIDSQFWSSNAYVGLVFVNQPAAFGLNLADGRIKGYPSNGSKLNYVYFVRGNEDYGVNNFTDNSDGTITDSATQLMWAQADDGGTGMSWEDALTWAQARNAEGYLGHDDWRLPNAKELHSIVDYTRSPDTTGSAAIDPVFDATEIINEAGESDYAFYWTSTTHLRYGGSASAGVYIAFGRGLGTMDNVNIIDVHGAGCQRSDPKDGDPNDYPSWGNGPQGDVQRVFNYVRLVRDAEIHAVGDVNCDGLVNLFDIDAFVAAVISAPDFDDYNAAYPGCNGMLADVNDDGTVDTFDIDPFVILLTGE